MRTISVVITFLFVAILPSSASAFDANCWNKAAARYHLDPVELAAHACVESGMHADVVHVNRDGSVDIGAMQINSRNLPRFSRLGITRAALDSDACLGIHLGTYILSELKARYGDSWNATGAYNAACTQLKGASCEQARAEYAWRIYRAMHSLRTRGHC